MNNKTLFAIVVAFALIGVLFAGCTGNSTQTTATTTDVVSGSGNANAASGQSADTSNLTLVTADDTNLSDII